MKANKNGQIITPVLTWIHKERILALVVGKFRWLPANFPNAVHIEHYAKHASDMTIYELMAAAEYPTEQEKDDAFEKLMALYESSSEIATEMLAGLANKALILRLTKPEESVIRKSNK